jgi:hypothetical protein
MKWKRRKRGKRKKEVEEEEEEEEKRIKRMLSLCAYCSFLSGQIFEMALCMEHEDNRISDLARHFFTQFSKKGKTHREREISYPEHSFRRQ